MVIGWLPTESTEWCQRYLPCCQPASDVAENLGVPCTVCRLGDDFELIPMAKMETRNHIEDYFGCEFMAICKHCGVIAAWSWKIFAFVFLKTTPYGKIFKLLFQTFSLWHWLTCCTQISWNLAHGKSVKSCVAYLTKKFRLALQLLLLRGLRPKSAKASSRQCTQSVPDFIQIGSLSAEL